MAKAVIKDATKYLLKSVKLSHFYNSKITHKSGTIKINQTLPFRVKFTNVGIHAYGRGNAAPIGIAIIGVNNYVM
jgi:hypothetical protein